MLVIHIYPYRGDAAEAFRLRIGEIKNDPSYDINYSSMRIIRGESCVHYWGGHSANQLKGARPNKFVVHDRSRCFRKVLEVIRGRELFAGVEVKYV